MKSKPKSSTWFPSPSTGWACIHCGRGFPSIQLMQEHIEKVHNNPGIPDNSQTEEKKEEDKITDIIEKQSQLIETDDPKKVIIKLPLELTYKWIGTCPQCSEEIETIIVDIDVSKRTKKQFAIAFCNNCKKNLKSREVIKL